MQAVNVYFIQIFNSFLSQLLFQLRAIECDALDKTLPEYIYVSNDSTDTAHKVINERMKSSHAIINYFREYFDCLQNYYIKRFIKNNT